MSEWAQLLRSIEPEYDIIRRALEMGPTIKPVLERKQRIWTVSLREIWPEEILEVPYTGSESLDDKVDWVTNELARWDGVKRMSWDQWYFDDKRHAEKFITLYYMKWAD